MVSGSCLCIVELSAVLPYVAAAKPRNPTVGDSTALVKVRRGWVLGEGQYG